MSIIKEVGLPKRPPQSRSDEGQDLSERVPPPRSSSPVIGSPPVRAVPIGTPPKQPMSHALNHQVTRNRFCYPRVDRDTGGSFLVACGWERLFKSLMQTSSLCVQQ